MMFMTAKVNIKKIAIAVAAAIVAILALSAIFGGKKEATPTAVPTLSGNDARVAFLKSFGWEVTTSPTESGQVRIPKASSEVFDRYNALQKSQGYDLSAYAGKTVMRYVYKIENYPNATDPVYATLLLYKNQVIGGDVTNTSPKGAVSGFKMPAAAPTEPEVPPTT
ncbi:MAG: DUF4830 domain-containing protein [Oscillospiraceae bacterium]|nr:DUF4830 domain-containing protein [Oscillospiraceae bacterium]